MKTIEDIKRELEAFVPVNQQEEKDKEVTLKYLHDFPNILTRENEYGHLTSSSLIFNKDRSKTLFAYHNIYKSWTWTGGHCDGDADLLHVALKEAKEETGVDCVPITDKFVAVDILPVFGHVKRGKYVSSHQHINFTFIFEADENQELVSKPDENSGVKWIPIDKLEEYVSEPPMIPVFKKIIAKAQKYV